MKEQRNFHALRAHIDELLKEGARIIGREPLTIRINDGLYRVLHGMLIADI
ncbi:hypothetical protein ACSC9U_05585 [Pseudomonas solani]|uniref:hypothetical protein n=1 Tax=Pseudomonas TaxID=286 RepID=UPI0013DE096D|nr:MULTISPECIES: hypothetical protein [Pseudomonas]MCU9947082.1 hypothetical protein [Pseudomonas sp. PDM13]MDN4147856.1 hypothetical protein [Pseudomonas tohonis]